MSEDLTGRRIGHYRIDGVLGRGGMSVMYRATDVRLGRKVALKVIAEHLTKDPEFRERFVDEARNTSAIDHSNVVPLYDFGEAEGLLYIAMRLVDGSDLASLIKDGPLAPGRALALLGQIAEALDMLHERGLVHLDVKPANVLVTAKESASEHVYLADFGLTRRGATGHRTRGGDFLGSPTYAAPEHLRGEPVDGRTDEYSMACVLFACLAGRPPFLGSVPEVISGHLNGEAPSLGALANLPTTIDEVIRRGMAKDPNNRYPDCRQLVAAARTALSRTGPGQRQQGPSTGSNQLTGPNSGPNPIAGPGSGPIPLGGQQLGGQQFGGQQQGQQFGRPDSGQYQARPPYQGGQGQQGQQGQSMNEPVRLRPPVPAGTSAFSNDSGGGLPRWLVPTLVGVALVVVIAVLTIWLTGR